MACERGAGSYAQLAALFEVVHLGVDRSGVILVHTLTEATADDATIALDLLTCACHHGNLNTA